MPTFSTATFPTPKSWDEFEDIVCDAAKLRWNSSAFFRHGRSGQPQAGVDVYATDRPLGLQCKLIEALTEKIVLDEVEKAETFQPALKQFYIATTAPRDAKIQAMVRALSEQRTSGGQFSVDLLFWDDLCQDLAQDAQQVQKHFPQFFRERVIANSQQSTDWQALCAQRDKLQQRVRQYPGDSEFQQELAQVLQQMEDFKRDVLKLAEDISKLSLNTERLRLAKAAFEAGNYQAAREILDTAAMAQEQTSLLARQQQLQTQQAEIAGQLANNATEYVLKAQLTAIDYSLPNRIEQTITLFETALKSARQPEHLSRYAKFLQDHSEFEESSSLYLEALAGFREIRDKSGEATVLNNLGVNAIATSKYDTALDYLQQSLAIQRKIGDKAGKGATLNNLSQIYKAHGDYATALDYLQQSLVMLREIGDKAGEGVTLSNLAQIYKARGDYTTAQEYWQQSLAIQRKISDKTGEGRTLNNLSQIYKRRGDYATALDYLQQSLVIQRKIGDKAGEGGTLNNLSQIYASCRDYATALGYLQRSLAITREIGDQVGEGTTLNNLSQIYDAQGDYATALGYLQQSLSIQWKIGEAAGLCATLFNIGHIHWQKDEQREALQSWVMAYQIAQKIGDAQALRELEKLAGQLGFPNDFAGWETVLKKRPQHSPAKPRRKKK